MQIEEEIERKTEEDRDTNNNGVNDNLHKNRNPPNKLGVNQHHCGRIFLLRIVQLVPVSLWKRLTFVYKTCVYCIELLQFIVVL